MNHRGIERISSCTHLIGVIEPTKFQSMPSMDTDTTSAGALEPLAYVQRDKGAGLLSTIKM